VRRLLLFIPLLLAAAPPAAFDYYVLSLSWAPDTTMRFVVNGFWPAMNAGQNPESCGNAKKVNRGIVRSMLPYIPNASAVQREWATHGTCSGVSQGAFFNNILAARAAVQIPVQFTALEATATETPQQIEQEFASANSSFPETAFRTACSAGVLTEVRVCFDKDLKPQACAATAGECPAQKIQIRPVR
jgi:ribonuclease T2